MSGSYISCHSWKSGLVSVECLQGGERFRRNSGLAGDQHEHTSGSRPKAGTPQITLRFQFGRAIKRNVLLRNALPTSGPNAAIQVGFGQWFVFGR